MVRSTNYKPPHYTTLSSLLLPCHSVLKHLLPKSWCAALHALHLNVATIPLFHCGLTLLAAQKTQLETQKIAES